MAGMSFIGSYSGIDQATIDQLMEAERIPLNKFINKKENITQKKDAWKDINTRLNTLFKKLEALKDVNSFNSKIAKSSDDKYVSMTANTSAAEGKYNIKVKELATNSSIIGGHITENGEIVSANVKRDVSGTFEINGIDIELDSESSLRDVVGKINDTTKETGISATIVDNRIVLNDNQTGNRDIELSGTALDKIGLKLGVKDEKTGQVSQGEAVLNLGNEAVFDLNGIEIRRNSNTISDAIDGVTINLNRVHDKDNELDMDIVTISNDTEKATQAIQDFVDQYNSTMDFIAEKTVAGDPKVPGSKGILAGESSLQRLQTSLRRLITDNHTVEGSTITDISKLGVTTTDKSGRLSFDKDKFLEALEDDKDNVVNFFNSSGVDKTDGKGKKNTGIVDIVNNMIDGFISKKDGIIKSQNESFEKTLKDLSTRIENFEARMVKKEAYYVKTFTALDLAMMKAEDQMGWLQGQVDAMNGIKR